MVRRLLLLILLSAALLSTGGCASLFETEYFAVSDFDDGAVQVGGQSGGAISRYSELSSAINELVENHLVSGKLIFSNYEGSDLSGDLAQACWEISTNTPLGAYSVDYISYDLSQIVSYYEAGVYINYRRSAEQTAGIINVSGTIGFREALAENLGGYAEYLVISVASASISEQSVLSYVDTLYLGDPVGYVVRPEVTVSVYPASGMSRIFEISADFGYPAEELAAMSSALMLAANTTVSAVDSSGGDAVTSFLLAEELAGDCIYTEDGTALSATAWGAIVDGRADSEGMAMAYSVLCGQKDINCQVVSGRQNNSTHFWNIVRIDGEYYHVDVSGWADGGAAAVYLRRDADMRESYWWDSGDYPVCDGTLSYTAVFPPIVEQEEPPAPPDAPEA